MAFICNARKKEIVKTNNNYAESNQKLEIIQNGNDFLLLNKLKFIENIEKFLENSSEHLRKKEIIYLLRLKLRTQIEASQL